MTLNSRRCLGGVLFFVLAGCGGGSRTAPVEGKVLIDGAPLTVGTVIFTPDAAKGNTSLHEPRGKLDADGVYRIHQTKDQAGVAPGWYKISISAQKMKDAKDPYSYVAVIPKKYARAETSGLELEVVDHPAPGAYDIALSAREP